MCSPVELECVSFITKTWLHLFVFLQEKVIATKSNSFNSLE